MEYFQTLGKDHNVSEFQGAAKNKKPQPIDPLVEQMNTLLKVICKGRDEYLFNLIMFSVMLLLLLKFVNPS